MEITTFGERKEINKIKSHSQFEKKIIELQKSVKHCNSIDFDKFHEQKQTSEEKKNEIRANRNFKKNLYCKFLEIAKTENMCISKSPYSESFYLSENDDISWGYKPDLSYRMSDHWNWKEEVLAPVEYTKTHCKTNTDECFGLAIAQYINDEYVKIV